MRVLRVLCGVVLVGSVCVLLCVDLWWVCVLVTCVMYLCMLMCVMLADGMPMCVVALLMFVG